MQLSPILVPSSHPVDPAEYADEEVTYPEIGASDADALPDGYLHFEREARVGSGRDDLSELGARLTGWDVHRGAGLGVAATHPRATPGATVVTSRPLGPLRTLMPCRVVLEIAEERRVGFSYGTLPGNPVSGEERFTAELRGDDSVVLRLRSFSRLQGLTALAAPFARRQQRLVNGRYVEAASRLMLEARRRLRS